MSTNNRSGPLKNLRVLDAGSMIAGPLAATQMADFGADVTKIELPGIGDSMRHWAPLKEGKSLWWKVIARNKRLLTLKLSHPEGQEIFKKLIKDVDILIENYKPGTFEKWGLGYDVLSKINPGLVMVRVSGFGQTGPYKNRGGYGTIAEAFSGVPSFTGFPDKPPTLPGFPLADSVASTFAAMSAMFAVYNRDQGGSGKGQEIDVSLYEPLFRLVESQVIGFDQLGIVKERLGNCLAEDSPRNTYRTKDDQWVGISASSQKTYELLVEVMGMPELITDQRFINNSERCANNEALDEKLAVWFAERNKDEIMELFIENNVVAGPVMDISDIFKNEQYAARESIISVPDVDFDQVKMQGAVPKFSETPGEVRHSGGNLGQDSEDILRDQLGLDAAQIEHLKSLNVV